MGVLRWVLDKTISRKSAAVGTGAIAFSPLVDIVAVIQASEVKPGGKGNRGVEPKNSGYWNSQVIYFRTLKVYRLSRDVLRTTTCRRLFLLPMGSPRVDSSRPTFMLYKNP